MKDKRIIIIIVLAIASILTFTIIYKNVNITNLKADSGWDSDFDSGSDWGGSDWGGSDWGSSDWGSSSWDNDWGSSSSSSSSHYHSSSSGSPFAAFFAFGVIMVIVIGVIMIERASKRNKHITNANIQEHILKDNPNALEEIAKEIPGFNKEEFYDYVYKNFVDVQEAWMNFDYDKLRKLVTDELFNTYKSQLKVLETKKQINVMTDFTRSDIAIINYNKSDNKHTITLKMTARFFDYLVDKDKKVIRGSDTNRIIITYILTYVSSTNEKKANKCPNCNAPLDGTSSSNVCPYCKSTIVGASHDFILSKKEAFEQRRE